MGVQIQVEFIAKSTVRVRAEVTDDDDEAVTITSPSTIKCTITSPSGDAEDAADMAKDETLVVYDHFFDTETTSETGWWAAEVVVVDGANGGAKTSVGRCSFKVKA